MQLSEYGALAYVTRRTVLRVIRKESRRFRWVIKWLTSFAASWQSVFGFLYWGAHPDKPGHNHSSSPFTTLSDRAERKVVSTGAGQPNYWPKTWFGDDAYKAKLVTPKCATKLFGLVGNSYVSISSPWQHMPRCMHEITTEARFSSLSKANTEYGLCWLASKWYVKRNLYKL